MNHDTLMALCDSLTSYQRGTVGRIKARAALSAAIADLIAERDANAKDAAYFQAISMLFSGGREGLIATMEKIAAMKGTPT